MRTTGPNLCVLRLALTGFGSYICTGLVSTSESKKMSLADNLIHIRTSFVNPNCRLIAVSKTKPKEALLEAYNAGVRDFGENKVQELTEKATQLPNDIRWHMIGHLQRNKVKYIAPFVHLIHGVDSLKLLSQIDKEAKKVDRIIDCLLQVHIAKEETKFGFDEGELLTLMDNPELAQFNNVKVIGLMGMATLTDDQDVIRSEFGGLRRLFDNLASKSLPQNVCMEELSMGMSGDYLIAQEQGSTTVRIGSAIFGSREYN